MIVALTLLTPAATAVIGIADQSLTGRAAAQTREPASNPELLGSETDASTLENGSVDPAAEGVGATIEDGPIEGEPLPVEAPPAPDAPPPLPSSGTEPPRPPE